MNTFLHGLVSLVIGGLALVGGGTTVGVTPTPTSTSVAVVSSATTSIISTNSETALKSKVSTAASSTHLQPPPPKIDNETKCAQKEISVLQGIAEEFAKYSPYVFFLNPGYSEETHFNINDGICYAVSVQETQSALDESIIDVYADKVLGDFLTITDDTGSSSVVCRIGGVSGCTQNQFYELIQNKMESIPIWKQFVSSKGTFKIVFPTSPNTISPDLPSGVGISQFQLYVSQPLPTARYLVLEAKVTPSATKPLTTAQILNLMLGGALGQIDPYGEFTTIKTITYEGTQGLEFDVETSPDKFTGRLFFTPDNNRAYMVYRVCRINDCNEVDYSQFLSSFHILGS